MENKLPPFMEAKKEEYAAAIIILKTLLADPENFKDIDAEAARELLVGRLETLEADLAALHNVVDALAAPVELTGNVDAHYHDSDRDLANSSGKLPLINNSDEVTAHIDNVGSPNPHNLTYLILGSDLGGMTLTGAGAALNETDIPGLLQVQNLIADAVAGFSGIDLSAYEPIIAVKNTAFNKNFGTETDTVAEGNHNHNGTYELLGHDHDGIYEPTIEIKGTAFNKNYGSVAGTVAEGNHVHADYALAEDLGDIDNNPIVIPVAKNLVNLLGTTGYDEAFFGDEKSVYGVFNNIKDKLENKANTIDLASKLDSNPTISAGTATKITYDDKGLVTSGTTLMASDIPDMDASKIISGVINIARLPASAIERLVPVADEASRFALTTLTVQNGDTVKELDSNRLFAVTDDTQLDNIDGYTEYTAGIASAVDWSGITNIPTEFAPEAHTLSSHSDVDGFSDSVPLMDGVAAQGLSNRIARQDHIHPRDTGLEPVIGAKRTAFNKDFGSVAGTVAEGNHVHADYALSTDVGDIAQNPISLSMPATYATNTDDVEIIHTAPADVTTAHNYKTLINVKAGTINTVQLCACDDSTFTTNLKSLYNLSGEWVIQGPNQSLASLNSPERLEKDLVVADTITSNGAIVTVTGNIGVSLRPSIKVVIVYNGADDVRVDILDSLGSPIVVQELMQNNYNNSNSYNYSGTDINIDIQLMYTANLTMGNVYDVNYIFAEELIVDRYFIRVITVNGSVVNYNYIGGDGSVSDGSDKSLAIFPGTELGMFAGNTAKNIVSLIGNDSFDTNYFDDNHTIYGVFNDIKSKLLERPTLAEVKTVIGETGSIQLTPEFGNSVFGALNFAPNTLGAYTSEHDLVEHMNYYKWVALQSVAQSYGIIVHSQMPHNFKSWTDVSFFVKTEGASSVTMKIFDTHNALIITVPVTLASTWTKITLDASQLVTLNTGIDSNSWEGNLFKLIFETSSINGEACYVGHVSLEYDKN